MTLEEGMNTTDAPLTVAFYHHAAHIELSLLAQGRGRAFFPIWSSSPPSSGDCFLDLRVEVGIALEIEADIDVRTGFTIAIPDGSFLTYIPSSGIQETKLAEAGGSFEPIPLHVESGSALFKAALRTRFVLGLNLDPAVVDAVGEVGAYFNIPELAVNVHPTDTCGLEEARFLGISLGLWAEGDVSVGWKGDDALQADGERTFATTPLMLRETATDCLLDNPTSIMIGGAPPITSDAPKAPTTFEVAGAPPITCSKTATTVKVDGSSPSTTSSRAFATGSPQEPTSISNRMSFATFRNSTVTAPPSSCPDKLLQTMVATDVVELYTTIYSIIQAAAEPGETAAALVKTSVHNEDITHLPPSEILGTLVPQKDRTLARPTSQPSVPRESTPTYHGNGKSDITEHFKVVNSTLSPHHDGINFSVVPATAGDLGYKNTYALGGFLAVAVCFLVL
ncbi:hypothetical protein NW762_011116 [Fusarium torreyae]|uniref:Uncharacterized protein n=1 Tax=Fusarium torreyae TaxID=1237075 RepID=A0A9W8VCL4_9HYPO|nr:hypothetical protein NW762_011116 [Fusarium torreyae]